MDPTALAELFEHYSRHKPDMRKHVLLTAHMLAQGIRASTSKPGAHEAVGIYLAEVVPDPTGSVGKFQRMRSKRNATEYRDRVVGEQEITSDLIHATNIVAAVRADLGI